MKKFASKVVLTLAVSMLTYNLFSAPAMKMAVIDRVGLKIEQINGPAVDYTSSLPVSANSPPPKDWFDVQFSNLPEGTVYLDLLVYLPESDPYYTPLEEANLPEGISPDAQIVTYCQEDFRSYTFHYREAKSAIAVKGTKTVTYFYDNVVYHDSKWGSYIDSDSVRYKHLNDVLEKGEIRLAMLDAEGNILHISPVYRLEARKFMGILTRDLVYNAADDTMLLGEEVGSFGVLLYLFLAFLGMQLTCLVEWLVAVIMKLRHKGKITIVNLVSQILMHTLYIAFYSLIFWRYTVALILLELLVYAGEFLVYRFRIMGDQPTKKILLYTIIANSASLGLGLLLLWVLGVRS